MYLTQSLHRAVQQYPDKIATIFGDRQRTYRELGGRVAKLAGALQNLDVKAGDRIAILAANSDDYLETYLAVWWAGAVINPVNIRWSAAEIVYSLNDCDASILLVDSTYVDLAQKFREDAKTLRHLIYMGQERPPEGMLSFDHIMETASCVEDSYRKGDDIAAVMYTGGTTGFPKGVVLSHTNIGLPCLSSVSAQYGYGSRFLHAAPMFHAATLVYMVGQLLNAGTHVIIPTFSPVAVMEAIQKEKTADVFLVPTMIQMIVDHPARIQYDLSALKHIWYGGSTIAEALLERAMAAFPNAGFIQLYGLTEMPVTALLSPYFHTTEGRKGGKLRAAGCATSITMVKICDTAGKELPRGSVGEIVIAGPNVMQGYWNKPAETAAALLESGWLRTGDGGYMDDDGLFYVVDRIKDMFISGGENIYAAEVENAIAQHPSVATCAVIGVPSEQWGETVHAVVVLKSGIHPFTAEELLAHCRKLIAGYKCPRSVEFRTELPISGAGKVLKHVLREPHRSKEQA